MKIKNRIVLFSFTTVGLSMFLIFLLFYFFIFSEAKRERIAIFESQSINVVKKFDNFLNYYKTVIKKYAPSKEFIYLLNENYFISNLSINSSKKLINKIKINENEIKEIYIFDKKNKEMFEKKISIDIKKLFKKSIIIKRDTLFVHHYIDKDRGSIVFEIDLNALKKDDSIKKYIDYYVLSKSNVLLLHSKNFTIDKNTRFSKETKLLETNKYLYYNSSFDEYSVGTKVSKKDLFKNINTLFLIIIFSIFIITFLSLLQTVKSASILTSSIYKLISVLETNKNGKYNKISLKGDDEIEYFIKKYNEMIDRISTFTSELENKVKERTKEVERQKEELKLISQVDTLTGIYNRNKLNEIFINKKECKKREYSIIILDIDNFKTVNDTLGHSIGDQVLKEFAKILKSNIRATDFLGRWGGEEFIIVCSNIRKDKAFKVAQELRKKIENHNFPKNLKLTASMGISEYNEDISFDELFILADRALLKAKDNGKNQVVISGE